jgi:hypothetical protein
MKRSLLFISFLVALSASVKSQEKKISSKINLLGAGYGLEYFTSSKFSFYNEIGLSYWGKVNDKIQEETTFSGKAIVNPYILSSFRYYFVPLHKLKNEEFSIGWRLSTTYTGLFTFSENFKSKEENSHQLGIFTGTTILFSKNFYLEVELGPGYDFGNLYDYKFNLVGNAGLGFRF